MVKINNNYVKKLRKLLIENIVKMKLYKNYNHLKKILKILKNLLIEKFRIFLNYKMQKIKKN